MRPRLAAASPTAAGRPSPSRCRTASRLASARCTLLTTPTSRASPPSQTCGIERKRAKGQSTSGLSGRRSRRRARPTRRTSRWRSACSTPSPQCCRQRGRARGRRWPRR
eukprot:9483523-Pyramimonas_sp.AAC.1